MARLKHRRQTADVRRIEWRLAGAHAFSISRIRIAHRGQIRGARTRVQFTENRIVALLRFQFGHAAVRVVGIAKDDGLGRAGSFARGHNFAVGDWAILLFRLDARVVDALHAVRALFHNAAAAHGHFRIAQQLERRRLPILEAQEIEAAHLVGAVVRTIARADAAVVNHVVQAFGAVHGRADRANLFARRVFALLARHRLEIRLWIRQRVVFVRGRIVRAGFCQVIAIDADPVHLAAAHDLIFADDCECCFPTGKPQRTRCSHCSSSDQSPCPRRNRGRQILCTANRSFGGVSSPSCAKPGFFLYSSSVPLLRIFRPSMLK